MSVNQENLKKLYKMFGVDIGTEDSGKLKNKIGGNIFANRAQNSMFDSPSDGNKDTQRNSMFNSIFNYWKTLKITDNEIQDRFNIYNQLDTMYNNNAILGRAIDLVADEIIQRDMNTEIVGVESKNPKIKNIIQDFFKKIQIKDFAEPIAHNLVKYGDAFFMVTLESGDFSEETDNSLKKLTELKDNSPTEKQTEKPKDNTLKGVKEILLIDVYSVEDRIEFTPAELARESNTAVFKKNFTNSEKLTALKDYILAEEDDYAAMFKSYLFGFDVEGFIIPPWRMMHVRRKTSNKLFSPFGMPLFLKSLFPYKQYENALSLQILARSNLIPKNQIKVKSSPGLGLAEAVEELHSFKQQYENAGLRNTQKDTGGIEETIYSMEGVYEYEQINNSVSLGRIDDIEILRDDVIVSTPIPKGLLDNSDSMFGESGTALIEQSKPFQRLVSKMQSAILESLTLLVKIHLELIGQEIEGEDNAFELTMPYPESQVNSDLISSQEGLLTLANTIIDEMKIRVLGEDFEGTAPMELIRDVYEQVLSYNPEMVSGWLDKLEKLKPKPETTEEDPSDLDVIPDEENVSFNFEEKIKTDLAFKKIYDKTLLRVCDNEKKLYEKRMSKIVNKQVNTSMVDNNKEYIKDDKHYYSSLNEHSDFDLKILYKLKEKRVNNYLKDIRKKTTRSFVEKRRSHYDNIKNKTNVKYKSRRELMEEKNENERIRKLRAEEAENKKED